MQTLMLELAQSRSPYGERGLKFGLGEGPDDLAPLSLSLRRAWIEILGRCWKAGWGRVALLTESVD